MTLRVENPAHHKRNAERLRTQRNEVNIAVVEESCTSSDTSWKVNQTTPFGNRNATENRAENRNASVSYTKHLGLEWE